MKIKIGTVTEDIKRMSNEIFKNSDTGRERISVELKNSRRSVTEMNELLDQNFAGTLILIDDEGIEETFEGYELETIRKSYDATGKQITLGFKIPGDVEEV